MQQVLVQEVVKEVPVDRIVEVIKEVPVEKVVEVEKIVQVLKEVRAASLPRQPGNSHTSTSTIL